MIEFVVENGTGLSNATSYIDEAYFIQYWENRGLNFNDETPETIQAWLNIATEQIDMTYEYKGKKTVSTQALQFPRSGIFDRDENPIDENTVPEDVEKACAEMAKAYYDTGDLNQEPGIKTRAIADVTIEYQDGITQPKYQNGMKYLKWYIYNSNRRVDRV